MEYSVTDNEGRSVSVNADNWLFAAASAFQALGVDLDHLARLDCLQDAEDGTMQIDMPGIARSWVVRRAERLEPASDLPWETPTVLASPIQALPEPEAPEPEPIFPPPPQGLQGVVPREPTQKVPQTNPAPIDTALGAVPMAPPPPRPRRHREPQPTMIPVDEPGSTPDLPPERELEPEPEPVLVAPQATPSKLAPQPVVAGPEPVVAGPEPVVAGPEPVVAAPEPVVTAPEPVAVPETAPVREPVAAVATPVASPPKPKMPELRIVISSRSQKLEDEEPEVRPEVDPIDLSVPPPSLKMPVTSTLEREPQESLAERLFDLSMDLVTAEPDEACDMALDLVSEFVPCEAASVIRGTLNDDQMRFVSVSGPVAGKLKGRTIPFGKGLVGMCFDQRSTLLINNVKQSVAHLDSFDQETGFSTLSALCVPILDDEGLVYGVIELLNPTDRPFLDEDEEAVETIARTLAGALAFR